MEASLGSVGKQGRLIIALVSLNFVLYINHAASTYTRTCLLARTCISSWNVLVSRLWSDDGGRDPFRSSPPSLSPSSANAWRCVAGGCEFRTESVRHAYPCPAADTWHLEQRSPTNYAVKKPRARSIANEQYVRDAARFQEAITEN